MSFQSPGVPFLTGYDANTQTYQYEIELENVRDDDALLKADEYRGYLERTTHGFKLRYSTTKRFDEQAFYDAAEAARNTLKVLTEEHNNTVAEREERARKDGLVASGMTAPTFFGVDIEQNMFDELMNALRNTDDGIGTPEFRHRLEWYPLYNKEAVLARYDEIVAGRKDA